MLWHDQFFALWLVRDDAAVVHRAQFTNMVANNVPSKEISGKLAKDAITDGTLLLEPQASLRLAGNSSQRAMIPPTLQSIPIPHVSIA